MGLKILAVDIETDGLDTNTCNILGVGFAKDFNYDDKQPRTFYLEYNEENKDTIKANIEDAVDIILFHNAKFDYKILKRFGITPKAKVIDTYLAAYITNPEGFHGLKNLAVRLLDTKMTKFEDLLSKERKELIAMSKAREIVQLSLGNCMMEADFIRPNQKLIDKTIKKTYKEALKHITLADIPVEEVAEYCKADALNTLQLASKFNLTNDLTIMESELALILSDIELTGVKIDVPFLKILQADLRKQIDTLKTSEINMNSSQQVGKLLFEDLGLPYEGKMTASGQYKVDAKVLAKIQDQDETGIIKTILEYKQLSKIERTYVKNLIELSDENDILHCSFNQGVCSTGRLSSSSPNLQNIPTKTEIGKQLRKAFISRFEDGAILSADYSQIELRVLAHMSEDPVLVEAFKTGQDVHTRTAAEVFKIPLDQVTPEQRYKCKTLNFALMYQQGAYATASQLGIELHEAQDFMDAYFKSMPKIKPFFGLLKEIVYKNGYSETLYGRRRYFYNLTSQIDKIRLEDVRAACNQPIQGTSADIIKIAMIKVAERLKDYKSKIVMTVHDEIVIDVHPNELQLITSVVKETMELNQPLSVPLIVSIKTGKSWFECK